MAIFKDNKMNYHLHSILKCLNNTEWLVKLFIKETPISTISRVIFESSILKIFKLKL